MPFFLKDVKNVFINDLKVFYKIEEINVFFYHFCKHILNINPAEVALNYHLIINDNQITELNSLIEKLKNFEPIQYIYGFTECHNLKFRINSNVLIPRPETEELVDLIIKENAEPYLTVLDIGTGSGCIAVSLAVFLKDAQVSALDVSPKALETANQNAHFNNASVNFYQEDILKVDYLPKTYDLIVSNPPYVRMLEKANMHANVIQHEPHIALFVDDTQPLIFYDKISNLAFKHLNPNGKLYFEINQYLGGETLHIVQKNGFSNAILKKDFLGNDRFIIAVK